MNNEPDKPKADTGWTTKNELDHIDMLVDGTYLPAQATPMEPVRLLEGYLKGCAMRVYWGEMDHVKVIEYAEIMLAKLKGGASYGNSK